jgi:histidinol-phosphate aminotransferase
VSLFWSELAWDLSPYVAGEQPQIPGLVKLNTNESCFGPFPKAIEAIRAAAADTLRLYPHPQSTRLREALASYQQDRAGTGLRRQRLRRSAGPHFRGVAEAARARAVPRRDLHVLPVYCRLLGIDCEMIPLDAEMRVCVNDYLGGHTPDPRLSQSVGGPDHVEVARARGPTGGLRHWRRRIGRGPDACEGQLQFLSVGVTRPGRCDRLTRG